MKIDQNVNLSEKGNSSKCWKLGANHEIDRTIKYEWKGWNLSASRESIKMYGCKTNVEISFSEERKLNFIQWKRESVKMLKFEKKKKKKKRS